MCKTENCSQDHLLDSRSSLLGSFLYVLIRLLSHFAVYKYIFIQNSRFFFLRNNDLETAKGGGGIIATMDPYNLFTLCHQSRDGQWACAMYSTQIQHALHNCRCNSKYILYNDMMGNGNASVLFVP